MRFTTFACRLASLCLAWAAFSSPAEDLFQVDASSSNPPGPSFSVTGNSLVNLVQDLINAQGQFQALSSSQNFNATLRYGTINNALSFSVFNSGTAWQAQLSTPFQYGLISRTFTAPTQSALDSVIKDYFKSSGSSDLAKFLAAVNQNSAAGVMDGNPSAATAHASDLAFNMYAFGATDTAAESSDDNQDKTGSSGFSMTGEAGTFSSKGLHGSTYSWTPMIPFALGEARRVRLEVALPLSYTKIGGGDEYSAGLQLAVPVLICKHTKIQPWTWQVTPLGGAVAAGSLDLVAGGVIVEGGLASYTSYHWHAWEFSMGNAAVCYEGIKLNISGYSLDPNVSQQILKNGLKIGRQLGQHWYAEAYAIDTEFVQAAFTPRYTTLGVGVGYRGRKGKGFLMLGGYTDIAPSYSGAKLQFGTGWKF